MGRSSRHRRLGHRRDPRRPRRGRASRGAGRAHRGADRGADLNLALRAIRPASSPHSEPAALRGLRSRRTPLRSGEPGTPPGYRVLAHRRSCRSGAARRADQRSTSPRDTGRSRIRRHSGNLHRSGAAARARYSPRTLRKPRPASTRRSAPACLPLAASACPAIACIWPMATAPAPDRRIACAAAGRPRRLRRLWAAEPGTPRACRELRHPASPAAGATSPPATG